MLTRGLTIWFAFQTSSIAEMWAEKGRCCQLIGFLLVINYHIGSSGGACTAGTTREPARPPTDAMPTQRRNMFQVPG